MCVGWAAAKVDAQIPMQLGTGTGCLNPKEWGHSHTIYLHPQKRFACPLIILQPVLLHCNADPKADMLCDMTLCLIQTSLMMHSLPQIASQKNMHTCTHIRTKHLLLFKIAHTFPCSTKQPNRASTA